jgi:hydrogenase expression/formation protein HypC
MCLAVPGRVIAVAEGDSQFRRTGTIDFQGNRVEVSLALVPKAGIDSWVLVHAGMAIEILDEAEARDTWRWLEECGLGETPEALKDPA